ncbi:ty3-gypsy retrotransposon protein [Tanacetum coccineum]
MDENTVRLWLDHADAAQQLAQQQAAAFQQQFDALRVELQGTRGLFQARNGGGDDQGSLLPRSMLLDVPKFTGTDQDKGAAAEWFRWMTRNGLITNWDGFEESVKNRFGPSKYEDPHGALSKLLQTGSVTKYQNEFEKLMIRVKDVLETLLISFYISGLKLSLQRELLVAKLTTLGDAFSLAHVIKARLEDQGTTSVLSKVVGPSGGIQSQWATSIWVQAHKCPDKFLLMMAGDDMDAESVANEEAVESGDISILNSLIGHGSP